MKPCAIILFAGCLWGIPALYAQEAATSRFSGADSAAFMLLPSALPPVSVEWLQEATDPILRERRQLYRLREQLSQHSVVAVPAAGEGTKTLKTTGLWRLHIGNTGADNWSPYPDRELDARIISFPMRRDARADKRSDAQKALDNIRGRK